MVDGTRLNYQILAAPYTVDKDDFIEVLLPVYTTAQLADVAHRVNTVDKFVGKRVFNSTLGQPVYASAATPAAAWSVVALGNDLEIPASAGITGFAETYGASVVKAGGIIHTSILIDLTGLEGGTAGDIIGDATPSISHLGQLTVARNGTLVYGTTTCLETPAGGSTDVDLHAQVEATGVQDVAVSGLTGTGILLNNGAWTGAVATPILMTALPAADEYLYLVDAAGTAVEHSAGRFLFEFFGV